MIKWSVGSKRVGTMVCCLAMSLVLGCGGDDGPTYATVTGKVTMDGQPIKVGSVIFIPTGETKGPASSGAITAEGTYEILGPSGKGVVTGTHKVMLVCPEEGSGPDTGENPMAGMEPCVIPLKYSQESSTDITRTVEEGENTIDLQLTK